MRITSIPLNPKMLDAVEVELDGHTVAAVYYGVAVKQGELLLTLGGIPAEHGGTKAKGWLDTPLSEIDSHAFAMTPKQGAAGYVHHWTPRTEQGN